MERSNKTWDLLVAQWWRLLRMVMVALALMLVLLARASFGQSFGKCCMAGMNPSGCFINDMTKPLYLKMTTRQNEKCRNSVDYLEEEDVDSTFWGGS